MVGSATRDSNLMIQKVPSKLSILQGTGCSKAFSLEAAARVQGHCYVGSPSDGGCRVVSLMLFGLRTPLHSSKVLRIPGAFVYVRYIY